MADKKSGALYWSKTLFRLLRTQGAMDLSWFLRDARYCLLQMTADAISALSSAAGIFLLSERFGGFGGMERNAVLFMLGYATLVNGVHMVLFASANAGQVSRIIGRGQLDHCVLQPVPLWMQLLTIGFSPFSGCANLLCGVALITVSAHRLNLAFTAGTLVLLITSVLASTALMMAVVYIVSCTAFWAPAAAEEISMEALDLFFSLNTFPLGGLPAFWQVLLCTGVPVGLTAWLPARLLTEARGLAGSGAAFGFIIAVAALFVAAAGLLFRKGMKHYATQGSPRYTGFGHR